MLGSVCGPEVTPAGPWGSGNTGWVQYPFPPSAPGQQHSPLSENTAKSSWKSKDEEEMQQWE